MRLGHLVLLVRTDFLLVVPVAIIAVRLDSNVPVQIVLLVLVVAPIVVLVHLDLAVPIVLVVRVAVPIPELRLAVLQLVPAVLVVQVFLHFIVFFIRVCLHSYSRKICYHNRNPIKIKVQYYRTI